MAEHNQEDLEHRLFHRERMDEERKISDDRYAGKWLEQTVVDSHKEAPTIFASKWTEKLLTAMIVVILLGFLGALWALVVK